MPTPARILLAAIAGLLGGCGAVAERPAPPHFEGPAHFTAALPAAREDGPWWRDELPAAYQRWVERLLLDSPALRAARADTDLHRARLEAAQAGLGMSADLSVGAEWRRRDASRTRQLSSGVDLQRPLDLSGRQQANVEARRAEYRAALARAQQVRLNQIQALLLALIDHAEAVQGMRLLREQIRTSRKQLHLVRTRFAQGLASSVDVLQQQDRIAALEEQLPEIGLNARQAANRVAELLGRTPGPDELPRQLPEIPATLPQIRPRDLLARRPELRAQRLALAAADADFEAALRARLPDVSVRGSTLWTLLAGNPSVLVQAALDASLSLFDSGARQAQIRIRRAQLEGAGIRYLQDWLKAVRETDDQLNQLRTQRERRRRVAQRLTIADRLYRAALTHYRRGVSDYLPVLSAVRELQQQQRQALHLRAGEQRILVRLKTAAGLPPDAAQSLAQETHR
jgi:outer membrane protein TolC